MSGHSQLPFNPQDFQKFLQIYQTKPGAVNPATADTPQKRQDLNFIQAQAFMSYMQAPDKSTWQPPQPRTGRGQVDLEGNSQKQEKPKDSGHWHGPFKCNHDHGKKDAPAKGHGHDHGGHGHDHGGHGHDHGGHGHDHDHDGHDHGGHGHDQGGHSHDGGKTKCNHDHGGGGGGAKGKGEGGSTLKRNLWFKKHTKKVRTFVIAMPIQGLLIMWFWFAPLIDSPFERFWSCFSGFWAVVMLSISYYYSIVIDPIIPRKEVPIFAGPGGQRACELCNGAWKPDRAKHCKSCGRCVAKMDHHCPWIIGCVGHHNHKAFVILCSYMSFGGITFIYYTFVIGKKIYNASEPSTYSNWFFAWWVFVFTVIFLVTCMATALTFFHTIFGFNNSSTFECMGGAAIRFPSCLPSKDNRVVSPYDKGFIPNIVDFTHNSMLWWWFPTRPSDPYDGMQFDQVPKLSQDEYRLHFGKDAGKMSISFGGGDGKQKGRTIDYQALIKEAEEAVDQKNLQFSSVTLQYGVRKDNAFKPTVSFMPPQNAFMNMGMGMGMGGFGNFQFGQFGSFA